jgi:methylmalonyl-CoA mutase
MTQQPQPYRPAHPIRVVTAASLFDGHDAAINIIRRILQGTGVEVIHLGHNRAVHECVEAAIQEDAHAIGLSCYQGGHMEFFKYAVDLLRQRGAGHIKVFGGGGGVIVPEEAAELEQYGVAKIYTPEDGRRLGLQGIINHFVESLDYPLGEEDGPELAQRLDPAEPFAVARAITCVERANGGGDEDLEAWRQALAERIRPGKAPVLGVTGTGGSGKSSLTDELMIRMLADFPELRVAMVSVDPTRRKSGGALLGDRIRMNALESPRLYLRSLATRLSGMEVSASMADAIRVAKAAGYDLVIAETAGIGQGDAAVVDLVDASLYVMTSDFGAASQLEKIDMLDFADLVAINKFDRRGAEDALRDVRKQMQRNQNAWHTDPASMPVYGTIAAKFNDDGVTALYLALVELLNEKCGLELASPRRPPKAKHSSTKTVIVPPERNRYLAEIADTVRRYHAQTAEQAGIIRRVWQMKNTHDHLAEAWKAEDMQQALDKLRAEVHRLEEGYTEETHRLLAQWPRLQEAYSGTDYKYKVRDREFSVPLTVRSLSGSEIPKVCLPRWEDPAEVYTWLRSENLPGSFPYTAGVFPFKRTDESPTRMFAGEGDPFRTNRRFKYLSQGSEAARLSTAFDSVTLYGWDPDERPDIYGKVGTSGVSICTLEDMKALYDGFDLVSPNTSVSMTINGPAPIMLAFFFNTAIDQQLEAFRRDNGRQPDAEETERIRAMVLKNVRGTVQADILKEDQGQNTCIFSVDFALRMMGDIQQFFTDNQVRNFYSVSISGYHIAEAGANPISQLAFTLANGFTYVEYYLSRGMKIDDFAPNLSFFFSNGMDAEYTVIGRVARRIWAVAMREMYRGGPRSQMLKYHIQTSGRSLHSQEVNFNDIRTTLQALCAVYDNCNSLHTNAYDEAITTPSEDSVRRALAIQMIINREWGLAKNENPLQGAFIVDELTSLVEEAVLDEFMRLTARGGVLGAMETGYQRSRIQEESIYYETLKHTGELPVIGVNTFINPQADELYAQCALELSRASEEEKQGQLQRLGEFHQKHAEEAPAALERLQKVALAGGNVFAELMNTVRAASLGQITRALYQVGGMYRRGM